jgi:predicted AAA+ superfamily ATPase
MAINLLNIQPHKVSKDLSGYITFIYGPAKVGKTTLAT